MPRVSWCSPVTSGSSITISVSCYVGPSPGTCPATRQCLVGGAEFPLSGSRPCAAFFPFDRNASGTLLRTERGAADILQPDVGRDGGLTESRRIATLAELVDNPPELVEGALLVPNRPGLGIDVRLAAIEKYVDWGETPSP